MRTKPLPYLCWRAWWASLAARSRPDWCLLVTWPFLYQAGCLKLCNQQALINHVNLNTAFLGDSLLDV
jgi:hypothetical protein